MPPWVGRLTYQQLFTVAATVPTVRTLSWEAESAVAPSLLSVLGDTRLEDLTLGGLAVDDIERGVAAVAAAENAVVRLLRRLSPTLRCVCFSAALSMCLRLFYDRQWTNLLVAVGELPHLHGLTVRPACGSGSLAEFEEGGWTGSH